MRNKFTSVEEMIDNLNEFEYNGYAVRKLRPESFYDSLTQYCVYDKCSAQSDYEIVESKDEVLDIVMTVSKNKLYHDALHELIENTKFNYTYDLYKHINNWVNNYFGHGNIDIQAKHKDGKLSKLYKNAYIYLNSSGDIEVKSSESSKLSALRVSAVNNNIEYLSVRFKRRIKGSIKILFPINFAAAFKDDYDKLEGDIEANNPWWIGYDIEDKIKKAYSSGFISKTQYEELLSRNT